jgi:hypothetical protein
MGTFDARGVLGRTLSDPSTFKPVEWRKVSPYLHPENIALRQSNMSSKRTWEYIVLCGSVAVVSTRWCAQA